MSKVTEDEIQNVLGEIKHPAIDLSLLELGIIRSFSVDGETVRIDLAWPFPGIPIRGQIIESIRQPLHEIGAQVLFTEAIMNDTERQRFLLLEQKAWKGL